MRNTHIQTILISSNTKPSSEKYYIEDHHQTLTSFSEAVNIGCYICKTIWCRLPPDQQREVQAVQDKGWWKPMRYWMYEDREGRGFYKLDIQFPRHDSEHGSFMFINMRVLPTTSELGHCF
jgi:hypothetical protein